jgi:hypothetical protein
MRYALIILCFILFSVNFAYADIYKYIDENGVICYTDTTFGKKAKRVIKDNSDTATNQQSASTDSKKPKSYHRIIHEKASEYNIDPSLIKAVITTESNWNHRAISRKGAMGLMQLMPATANNMNVRNPFNPEENIEGGTKYLKYLLERFNGDLTLALAAYNAGPKAVEKFGYVPPITETKQYVKKVLSLYNGKTIYPSIEDDSTENKKKPELIYKVILEDGSVLFTNSTLLSKNPVRF